ncbi:hypothetical protein CAPTEDRAFT_222039 [Capitella teleta]|uniref:Reelin domain-containing protein n=1 Tax=Capitella teleta TaxID=283909 RepID=R7TVB7_CAPTE|nr:hypothetical protein CAPTEDRAFT_222039 [Capitella teleta]|eukprot:ELT94960.1 hypothetical protein CAPTEDRAFT_222039 [Capitella teleta]
MLLKCVCLVVLVGLARASTVSFDCEEMLPTRQDAQAQDSRDYPVFTQLSKNTYTPNDKIGVVNHLRRNEKCYERNLVYLSFLLRITDHCEQYTRKLKTSPNCFIQCIGFVPVTLSIRGPVDIRFFAAQMRVANSDVIRGTWLADDPIARTHACAHEADTLVNAGSESLTRLSVRWVAPHSASETGNEAVELKVTIMTEDGHYWTTDRPIVLRERESEITNETEEEEPANEEESQEEEEEKPQENADDEGSDAARQDEESRRRDEDDHGLRVEIEMIKLREEQLAHEIEAEDRASEGDWSITQEEERKQREEEMKREMYEYEMNKAREDEARQERMRAEIRDKEEWEAAQAKLRTMKPSTPSTTKRVINSKDENEIDFNDEQVKSGNGAAMATACVLSLLSALLMTLF